MTTPLHLYTIGFTQKTAEQFFSTLQNAGVKTVVDTRLNNVSQLAGFAKRKDLEYFLKTIANIQYIHLLDLAPTSDILDQFSGVEKWMGTFTTATGQTLSTTITDPVMNRRLSLGDRAPAHCLITVSLSLPWTPPD